MNSRIHSKKLLVEGSDDTRVIPELIEKNLGIKWEPKPQDYIVYIQKLGKDFVTSKELSTELKGRGLKTLGLILDADESLSATWDSIYNTCRTCEDISPDLPRKLPETGLIHSLESGIKFGVWIMPDNQTEGMLETFLSYLIPKEKSNNTHDLWNYTQQVVQEVKTRVDIEEEQNKGERFTDAHEDKAKIYTWLAWQEPPGRQLHQAIECTLLDPKHENSQRFVNWFKKLYDL